MEIKLIEKINQIYLNILNTLKTFLKENFNQVKENNKNNNLFGEKILKFKKKEEIEKYIKEYTNENGKLIEKMKNINNNIYMLINEILNNKNKIIENTKESLYLIKHPKDCSFLLQIDKFNNDIYNYLDLIYNQISSHKYDKIEYIYFIICNMKIASK